MIIIGANIKKYRIKESLTQTELAEKVGVSKSSVSKWETNQTYPDIDLLPKLATLFGITIDELIGYQQSLKKEDIQKLYNAYSKRFSLEPFKKVYEDCMTTIQKYYGSPEVLLQMSVLLINHLNLLDNEFETTEILQSIIEYMNRIKQLADNVNQMAYANTIEAMCNMQLGFPDKTIELLGKDVHVYLGEDQLLARAYDFQGDKLKASQIRQVAQYQSLMGLLIMSSDSLMENEKTLQEVDDTMSKITAIMSLFDLETLHPGLQATLYNNAFIAYTSHCCVDKGIEMLKKVVTSLTTQTYPLSVHGDAYFNQLDEWISKQTYIGTQMPRDSKLVIQSLIEFYTHSPLIVEAYKENEDYHLLINELIQFKEKKL